MKYFFSLIFFTAGVYCFAQNQDIQIDFRRISQEKIRNLIIYNCDEKDQLKRNVIQPTYKKGQSLKGYHIIESDYLFKENTDLVWNTYQKTNPALSWKGNMVSFGLLYSKSDNDLMYADDKNFCGIDTGQVIFVNLKILYGLYNLAVGLQIVDIDQVNKSITYSYLKGGKSRGEQTIYFVPSKKGYTKIIHQTAFKGNSFIRDYYLYPWFHRKAINEFHRNMKKYLISSYLTNENHT